MKTKLLLPLLVLAGAVALAMFTKFNRGSPQAPAGQQQQQQQQQTQSGLKQLGPVPATNASDADKGAFAQKVRSLATSTNTVTIGKNCALSPAIVSVKSGSGLVFKNQDNVDHGLGILEEIVVKAGTQNTLKATLNGPGIYGITCDGPTIVGYIDLSE